MSLKRRAAFLIYALNALGMLVVGLLYQFSDRFMPYHAEVIQRSWETLSQSQQILYIGMMRTEAAGFLATSLAIFILLVIPFRQGHRWSSYAIFGIGLVEYLPSALATFQIAQLTQASTPWLALWLCVVSLFLALLFSRADRVSAS